MRSEFLRFVASPNESLTYIIINYMFRYTFRITRTFLESLRIQKKPFNGWISAKLVIMTLFFRKMGFNTSWSSKWVPKTYYNTLYIQIHIYDQNNVAKHFGAKEALERLDFRKTGYKHLVLPWSEFLKLVRAPNESLRNIIINYMFKYIFGIKKKHCLNHFGTKIAL